MLGLEKNDLLSNNNYNEKVSPNALLFKVKVVTFATIQKELQTWNTDDQDRLAAYLTVLRLKRDSIHSDELRRRSEDRDPHNWLRLEEVKKGLYKDPPAGDHQQ